MQFERRYNQFGCMLKRFYFSYSEKKWKRGQLYVSIWFHNAAFAPLLKMFQYFKSAVNTVIEPDGHIVLSATFS